MKNRTKDNKPQYEIEIPSRKDILSSLKKAGKPTNSKQIAADFGMGSDAERAAIRNRLKAMVRDGQLIRNRRGGYGLVYKMDLIAGKIIGHADGYGFLVPDEGKDDIYLSGKEMKSLLHGDRAVVRISGQNKKGKYEGSLVEVLERANDIIVGRYFNEQGIGYVAPDNKRLHQNIFIPPGNEENAKPGQFVSVEITKHPDKHTQPVGRIIDIIGDHASEGIATELAIRAYELPHKWPKDLLKEIKPLVADLNINPAGRIDLRNHAFVTIDGEDAKDFDDAVYCEKHGRDWRLYVAIADVSHYVKPDTGLDQEAFSRGTSVYFPDRVIPMLPVILSNELCSLKPDVDRYAIVCEMHINNNGETIKAIFHEAIIRSAARLTYDKVAAILVEKDPLIIKQHNPFIQHLENLYELYSILHRARSEKGMLDFDTTESRMLFDDKGSIMSISPLIRNDAHRMIEEFMLAANICAAVHLSENNIQTLFRVHSKPKLEKIKDVREFLKEMGLSLGGGEHPLTKDYADLMEKINDRPDRHLIQTVLLRSMPQAVYQKENQGHFGLAFDLYAHFTSPIRRYPDLLVHRGIRHLLKMSKEYAYDHEQIQEYGMHCSMTERRADEATREVEQKLKCEYMKHRTGEIFTGTITGVTGFGLFVELNDVFVEGLVHVTALPGDYYHHDPVHHRLTGEWTGQTYRLANQVKVQLMRVDTDENKIDFNLAD